MGEVVAFTRPGSGRLAIHRIIAREGADWLIQGDNSREADGFIPNNQLIGRVTGVERRGHTVRFGLGRERRIIAWLARRDWLSSFDATFHLPRRMAAAFLYRLQSCERYRTFARRLFKCVSIVEAADEEMPAIQAYFQPNGMILSENTNPHVTNYIAKRATKIIGFVQLVRHPEPDHPMAGYWLFSLTVRTRYRGLGIGGSLAQRVIERSVLDGATELLLLVFKDNIRAIRLFRKLGFEQIILPALEPQLEAEELQHGLRHAVMRKQLIPDQ